MELRNPKVDLVATYLNISKDPETSGRTAEILAPSLDQRVASRNASEASRGRSRHHAFELHPEAQDQKLAAIKEKADGFDDYLYPAQVNPPPGDAESFDS